MVSYPKFQRLAKRLIKDFGMIGALRRDGVDRDCWVVVPDYTAHERQSLANPVGHLALLAATAPDGTLLDKPNWQQDKLVLYEQPLASPRVVSMILDIVAPQGDLAPAGITVYWELQVKG